MILNTIKIDDNFLIEVDVNNWTLKYQDVGEYNEKTGKNKIVSDHWYFPNLKLCLKKYLDQSLRHNDSINSILESIDKLEKNIDEQIN